MNNDKEALKVFFNKAGKSITGLNDLKDYLQDFMYFSAPYNFCNVYYPYSWC